MKSTCSLSSLLSISSKLSLTREHFEASPFVHVEKVIFNFNCKIVLITVIRWYGFYAWISPNPPEFPEKSIMLYLLFSWFQVGQKMLFLIRKLSFSGIYYLGFMAKTMFYKSSFYFLDMSLQLLSMIWHFESILSIVSGFSNFLKLAPILRNGSRNENRWKACCAFKRNYNGLL